MQKILVFAALSFILGAALSADRFMKAETKPRIDTPQRVFRVDLISIISCNPDSLVSWYISNLGFTINREMKFPDRDQLKIVFLKKNDLLIEVIGHGSVFSIEGMKPGYNRFERPKLAGFNKVAFEVSNIDSLYNSFLKNGLNMKTPLIDDTTFQLRFFILQDPEHNILQFVERSVVPGL